MRDEDLPAHGQEEQDDEFEAALRDDGEAEPLASSLTDEVAGLIADGKTYAEAELAYQKARLAFTADRGKSVALYGLFALGFVHLALIALVVGAVIALSPVLTPIGATLAVTAALLLVAVLLLLRLRHAAREIGEAFEKDEQ